MVNRYSHILLDIEGTTCPVNYVTGTLFPYASKALPSFLNIHGSDKAVRVLIIEIIAAWEQDQTPEAVHLLHQREGSQEDAPIPYIQWLIKHDKKLTALKSLQGMIWEDGYRQQELKAPLFDEVAATIAVWNKQGVIIGSYSSGSIQAQQLLYQYSNDGDIRPLFSHWFDTTSGNKKEASSYEMISKSMGANPSKVLFVSDARAELVAASNAGMNTCFSKREGNPEQSGDPFETIESLSSIDLRQRP